MSEATRSLMRESLATGIQNGISGFSWMLKILVPISFFTTLIVYSGWINKADFILSPFLNLIHLPSIAAIPLIIGMLTGIYGAIAAMLPLPLTMSDMTLMAIFLLISHNLIQETMVQKAAGMNPAAIALFRIAASVVTVMAAAHFLPQDYSAPAGMAHAVSASSSLAEALRGWGIGTFHLAVKIFCIIMPLMIILELMKAYRLIEHLLKAISPFLKLMGLDKAVGILWLTAVTFGLAYGAAVIVEETGKQEIDRDELDKLHLSIGINHSMVEDPALFLSLGIHPFWLWIPRTITAVVFVQLMSLCKHFLKKRRKTNLQVRDLNNIS